MGDAKNDGKPEPSAAECWPYDVGHPHLIGGEFQSDKYPTCPRGKVPLSTKDPTAQDLLWQYAQRRRAVDAEFATDLEKALRTKGYEPKPAALTDSTSPVVAPEWGGTVSLRALRQVAINADKAASAYNAEFRGELTSLQTAMAMAGLRLALNALPAGGPGNGGGDGEAAQDGVPVVRRDGDRGEDDASAVPGTPGVEDVPRGAGEADRHGAAHDRRAQRDASGEPVAHPWGDRERGTHAVYVEGIREGLRRAASKITALNPPGDREPYAVPEHGAALRTAILVLSRSDVAVDTGTLANVHARFDVPSDDTVDRIRQETVKTCAAWLVSEHDPESEGWERDALRAADELAHVGDMFDAVREAEAPAGDRDAVLRAEFARLQAISLAAAALSSEFGDDLTERDAPVAFALLKTLRAALEVAPGLAVVEVVGGPACRRCSECQGENHHWIEHCEEPEASEGDGFVGYICKHCPARAEMCEHCDGAEEPHHVCSPEDEDGAFEPPVSRDEQARTLGYRDAADADAQHRGSIDAPESDAATRESIARYLDHCASVEIGAISLDGLFDTRQMMSVCASWVRNRLDVKWAEETAKSAPTRETL